jgi:hypothetical protein
MAQSQIGSRLVYQNAKSIMAKNGFDSSSAVLSQSYLRLEVALNTTATQFRFPLVVNDNFSTQFNTQVSLNLQDVFVVSRMRLTFAKPSSSTAANFPLNTYPDASIFSTANTAASLYNWYNGYLQVTVNNRVIMPKWRLSSHITVPTQQPSIAYYAANPSSFIAEQSGDNSGWVVVEPNLLLSGGKQTDFTVTIPSSMTAVESNSRAIFELDGLLAQNTTSVR